MSQNMMDPNFIQNMNLRATLQHSLLGYFQTEDPLINAMITFAVISLITSIVPKIERIPGFLISVVSRIIDFAISIIGKIINRWTSKVITKKYKKALFIEKITDERQLNPLYNAVAWYLMNQVNLDEELTIKCMIDQKINETVDKLPDLLRRVTQDQTRELIFEGRTIDYKLSASQISIDGNDGTRRNDQIQCFLEADREDDTFLEHFVKVCMDQYRKYIKGKAKSKYIYQNMNGKWTKVCTQTDRMADTIVLQGDDKKTLMTEVEHFINNKEWYINHGFLYSLGILLHGSPGTGKTSLIRYISTITKRNTHYLRLTQIKTEDDFNRLLQEVDLSDTVLVMEDIDCAGKMVHSRDKIYEDDKKNNDDKLSMTEEDDNLTKILKSNDNKPNIIKIVMDNNGNSNNNDNKIDSNKDKLNTNERVTLDVLLNILDGILTTPGQIVIMTTNHKDILDSALIRPGRIDINLELSKCTTDMIEQLCKKFYVIELDKKINELIRRIPEKVYTPAHIMNTFRKYRNDPIEGLIHINDIDE